MNYRALLLSQRLKAQMGLRRLTHLELLQRLQVLREVDLVVSRAYREVERRRWRGNEDDDPHGRPWNVSFHASQFPSGALDCPRQALYQMMNFSRPAAFPRRSRQIMTAGKDIEVGIVQTLHEAGLLLSAPPDEEQQTGFILEDAWFTGSVDCVIDMGIGRPVPVEIKTKYASDILLMRNGLKGPDEAHIRQIKAQLGLVYMAQTKGSMWQDYATVTHGYIYYCSRDNPVDTAEFRVDLDLRFFAQGIQKLREWRQMFEQDHLPMISPTDRHPMGWRWGQFPCQWCNYKKTCKLDFQERETYLSRSVGINRTRRVREDYDPEEERQKVLDFWAHMNARTIA